LQDIVEAEPEILLVAPCGYSAQQGREEYRSLDMPEQWNAMPAVRSGRVYALEASGYFSRPGPRLTTGVEVLAKLFHPAMEVSREAEAAILPISTGALAARAASF
jgi:iron complex transport system substrate-binding protein